LPVLAGTNLFFIAHDIAGRTAGPETHAPAKVDFVAG
jgi:hypothetical protein